MFSASNKDHILTFTNLGRVFDIKAYNIAEGNIKSKGKKVESYLKLKDGEYATSILCVSNTQMNDSESSLLFVTKNGMIKRTKLEHFSHIMSCGIIATMLKKDDELIAVKYIDSSESMQDIILSTKNGLTVRYEYTEVADTRRDSMGVIGICLKKDDEITDCCIVSSDEQLIFFATKQGLGKVVRVTDMVEKKDPNTKKMVQINDGFPRLKRSSTIKGRMGIRLNEGDELVSLATIDNENQNLMVSTENKLVVVPSGEFRTPIKRDTFGKKLVKLVDGASVKKVIVQ
jgi:DNA gyrase subunit A